MILSDANVSTLCVIEMSESKKERNKKKKKLNDN